MPSTITSLAYRQPAPTASAQLFEDWFDPIEAAVRDRVHGFIQAMIEAELDEALSRTRYARHAKACPGSRSETPDGEAAGDVPLCGHRHGHRSRSLMGTFGETLISVPRARIEAPNGKTTEWRSKTLPAYQRRTKAADALIAGAYLAGTNTRRVRRALAAPRLREGRLCSAAR
jgi:putative transposase